MSVESLTGHAVVGTRSLGSVERCTLDDGREVVAKRGDVAAEAAGLRWLAAADAVAVPEVLGADDGCLVTAAVPSGSASREAAEAFGRSLAALHAAGAPAFGAPPPGGPADAWIGGAPMRNDPVEGPWLDWYLADRVQPYLRSAVDRGALSASDASRIENASVDPGPAEPPARLHGDLWSGNVLWSDRAWVIDPTAHGGHRETDLAMLALFGLPHLETVLAAYDEAAPLADGWRDRVGLHQLFPLLVHATLFGGGYGDAALRAVT
ncbi:fructosamine kinase family protein [Actinomycetospora termitidis]|uniref:Fructosamine kinase family protein n=1 Tax=Actinomycetospora termitidis TaxID=3053470 RepID=A0ABT7MAA6_9PSEU|nr:fructosamine kinase family protein [Actinomycetospora sp. Odt1-22]MDL5156767.1 fructosamine kinase family protein [Actinomycetospora sp. Odt1-22]